MTASPGRRPMGSTSCSIRTPGRRRSTGNGVSSAGPIWTAPLAC
jgi:hypothetical protein